MSNMCFWMCKICLFISKCNKTDNKSKLNSVNFNVIYNVIQPDLGCTGFLL